MRVRRENWSDTFNVSMMGKCTKNMQHQCATCRPFTGDVYQYLDPQGGRIKNLLRIKLPFKSEVFGGLIARQSVLTEQTWKIDFDYVTNGINIIDGRVRLGGKRKYFENNECRLWKHCYLDKDLRILEARKEEANEDDAFIFITNRVTDIPLPVDDI